MSHLAPTYAAVNALTVLARDDAYAFIDRSGPVRVRVRVVRVRGVRVRVQPLSPVAVVAAASQHAGRHSSPP
jgi:hypothetical protein